MVVEHFWRGTERQLCLGTLLQTCSLLFRHRLTFLSTIAVLVVVSFTQEASNEVLDVSNGPLAPVVSSLLAPAGVGAVAALGDIGGGALLFTLWLTEALSASLGGGPHKVARLGGRGEGEGNSQCCGQKKKSEE